MTKWRDNWKEVKEKNIRRTRSLIDGQYIEYLGEETSQQIEMRIGGVLVDGRRVYYSHRSRGVIPISIHSAMDS